MQKSQTGLTKEQQAQLDHALTQRADAEMMMGTNTFIEGVKDPVAQQFLLLQRAIFLRNTLIQDGRRLGRGGLIDRHTIGGAIREIARIAERLLTPGFRIYLKADAIDLLKMNMQAPDREAQKREGLDPEDIPQEAAVPDASFEDRLAAAERDMPEGKLLFDRKEQPPFTQEQGDRLAAAARLADLDS